MTWRGRRAREAELAGWEGLALAIIERAYRDRAFQWFETPWARMLIEGLGADGDRILDEVRRRAARVKGRQRRVQQGVTVDV